MRFLIELLIAAFLLCYAAPKVEGKIKSEFFPKFKKELQDKVQHEMPKAKRQAVIDTAKKYLGARYDFGGTSLEKGIDCSSFVQHVFQENGITLPRTASAQFARCVRISNLEFGDLVFFQTYQPGPSHVGVYLGNNNFIHSSSLDEKVVISKLTEPFYRARFLGARRVL